GEVPARRGEVTRDVLDELVMVDGPRDGDDEIVRPIVGAVVPPHRLTRDGAYGRGVAPDGAAERMRAERRLVEALARDIGGVVVGHGEFFEDDTALGLELFGVDE